MYGVFAYSQLLIQYLYGNTSASNSGKWSLKDTG